jgi:deoxycytidylate deaminase
MNLSEFYPLIFIWQVLSPSKVIFIGFCVLFSVRTLQNTFVRHRNTNDSQTATAVHADQDALFGMFERIEAFFRRLEIYTEVAPNQGMVDTITTIMVEVVNFIGIATKEMKQWQTSKPLLYRQVPTDKAICSKISKETDWKERYGGYSEEAR